MKLLVIGASGGTGRRLVQQALQQGHLVTAFARDPAKIKLTHANLRVVRGDVCNPRPSTRLWRDRTQFCLRSALARP